MSALERGRGLPHGVIGNGAITAIVHPDTGIDWLCLPRLDGPSLFGRLLDARAGGSFAFESTDEGASWEAAYVQGTNVLRTEVRAASGSFEVLDFAPWRPEEGPEGSPVELVRLIRPLAGVPRLRVRFDPRPDYARGAFEPELRIDGLSFRSAGTAVQLESSLPGDELLAGDATELHEPAWFRLSARESRAPSADLASVESDLDATVRAWRAWTAGLETGGFADAEVLRSALCLKLLASPSTGATAAAATTSLPEAIGEERTWDYRFCWLRDSVFTVEALRRLGRPAEGRAYLEFVLRVAGEGTLQPLYGLDGERDLEELILDHLDGFLGTRPVRIGNAAALQTQHDLMGEIVLALRTLLTDEDLAGDRAGAWFGLLERMVEKSLEAYLQPDLGIWEYRDQPRVYLFSQAMCWAAVHHGAALATRMGHHARAEAWRARASEMREVILDRGFDPALGMFVQAFDEENPDAANLLLPSIGIVDARDGRFLSTIERYRELLVQDHGVMRYLHSDDFGEPASTFTVCSFWWCEALAQAGEVEEARARFDALIARANPVGLFSEDLDAQSGELLGNFPQAYTHIGLIHAALTIGAAERGESWSRAWA
ncbi:MAG: glycoside hydrolase family 15 protein [Planctomycetota bacterium]|nr:glycoside hydrolase family 15 protein [Planctomycetota bacterium]